ncbi:MAG: hypothetical protein GXP34_13240 [Actinobacteria bacterium]|nr:hypothetical protein [Actinomycetota bacterium]
MKRFMIVVLAMALLVVLAAGPAWAYGSESGRVSCTNKIAVHSRTTQTAYIQVPSGSTVKVWYDGASPVTHTWASQVYGPNSWRVLSLEGTVHTAETYAYCWGE